MADKYTYADVIIDPNDPRVEIGAEYYFGNTPKDVLGFANKQGRGDILKGIYEAVQYPFGMENQEFRKCCLIRKKEPTKRYVPFDLSKQEDRDRLKGEWVRKKDNSEIKLIWWLWEMDGKWMINEDISPQELLDNWVFDFESLPCGKLVEE